VLTPQIQGDDLADDIRQELHDAVDRHNARKVIIDFRHVRYLASAGFRPLLSLYRRLNEARGRMVFCNLVDDVREVFMVTRLITTSRSRVSPFEAASDKASAMGRLKRLAETKQDGVLVLTLLDEKIQGDELADALRDEMIEAATRETADKVVLDFGLVDVITSAGLRPLLQLRTHLKEKGGRVALCGLSEQVADVLRTTRLITSSAAGPVIFETAPDVAEAVALLNKPAAAG
jgi:anti-anti-sigma factor